MAPNGEWDVFGWQWGLGLPVEWFDVEHILDTLDASTSTAIDQLVLGWEGKNIRVWDVVRQLLRSKGFFVGMSAEGKIRFPRIRTACVGDLANPTTVLPIPYTLKMEPSEGEGVDRITGEIGGVPWRPGVQYEVHIVGDVTSFEPPASYRQSITGEEVNLDLSTWTDTGLPPIELASLARLRSFGAPILHIKAIDAGYGHGDYLKVGNPGLKSSWFVNNDSTVEVSPDDDPRWFGQVIGFRRNLLDGTVDLDLIMHNWHHNSACLLRGPAASCDATPGTTTLALVANRWSTNATGDANMFTEGDSVELWRPDGVRRSGTSGAPDVQVIAAGGISADGTAVTLDAAFTTPAVEGDVLRWARVDDAAAAGNADDDSALLPGFLPYVCMADAAGTISSNNLDAHTYGFGTL